MGTRVEDVMTEDVVTAAAETSLETVAETMLRHDVGSVVVTTEGDPYGIVTESDLILAAYHTGRPLAELPTRKVASHPLVTVDPKQPIRTAIDRMRTERIKKLVVVDRLEMCGIVTTYDLIRRWGDVSADVREIEHNRVRRSDTWSTQR
ncbi:CBS domain-containing protein [Natrarchaeobaculum sulfurireducens]|uniref:CBS domain n=1 Tax=Natrarchaeobaculum sulfurireducens TaxID=2044521 RepID=A0A346PIF5_9EURY|nr:CBS domain-containing protein [Natrarchaeobaculum sulfurireducens]AXR79300.1 CBS domain [Natrarchaeobaculum sulfurireducens]AXR83074.1 CBS domain protein [Natrarchaeobaculum sulfurireducens]